MDIRILKVNFTRCDWRTCKSLNSEFLGRHMQARGYFPAISGNITDEVIMEYISVLPQEPAGKDFTFDE